MTLAFSKYCPASSYAFAPSCVWIAMFVPGRISSVPLKYFLYSRIEFEYFRGIVRRIFNSFATCCSKPYI